MSTDPTGPNNHTFEATGNQAFDNAHQNILYDSSPTNSPSKWNRRKKAILYSVLVLVMITIVVVVSVCSVVPSHRGFDSSSSTTETQTSPAVAPTGTQTPPPTSLVPSTTAPLSVATSATSTGTLPPPPISTADSIHLMNALDGTANSSGFAWYASAIDGNNGAQPNDYANTTATNVYAEWENQNRTAFFPRSDTTAWAVINSTDAPVNKADGEASNGHRTFVCYKDDGRILFKQNGSDFSTEYYCQ